MEIQKLPGNNACGVALNFQQIQKRVFMKLSLFTVFVFAISVAFSQTAPVQPPIEEQYHISYWWWILGVLIALGLGIALYMIIKKNPRKDAVR